MAAPTGENIVKVRIGNYSYSCMTVCTVGLQTHILELLQSTRDPDAKFQGAICSWIISKISDEIFVEHPIITNRLIQMLSENFPRNRGRRENEMSELITHVYGTWSESYGHYAPTDRQINRYNELIFHDDPIKRYRGCLLIRQMATHQPSQYYRKVVRTKALDTIERLIRCVKEFKDYQEIHAALTALRALLHLVASREEHIVNIGHGRQPFFKSFFKFIIFSNFTNFVQKNFCNVFNINL